MSNFDQFIGKSPMQGEPLKLALGKGWDAKSDGFIVLHQTDVRRALHIGHTPQRVTVPAELELAVEEGEDPVFIPNPAYSELIHLGRKSAGMVEAFNLQKVRAVRNRRNEKIVSSMEKNGLRFEDIKF